MIPRDKIMYREFIYFTISVCIIAYFFLVVLGDIRDWILFDTPFTPAQLEQLDVSQKQEAKELLADELELLPESELMERLPEMESLDSIPQEPQTPALPQDAATPEMFDSFENLPDEELPEIPRQHFPLG